MTTYIVKTISPYNPQLQTFKNNEELFKFALSQLINDKANADLTVLDFILKVSDMTIKTAIKVPS